MYAFPQPKKVPSEVKTKVMNHVYLNKKTSLLKRSSLVRFFSVSALLFGVLFVFSWIYLPKYNLSNSSNQSLTTVNESVLQNSAVLSKTLDEVDATLLETEVVLAELESII